MTDWWIHTFWWYSLYKVICRVMDFSRQSERFFFFYTV